MKNTGTMFIKNLRNICLVGVIALGLITIVGSNGGGGDGGTATTTTDTTTDTTDDTTAPEDVTLLSALPGDSKATLSWTASANSDSDLAGHKIYYSSDGGTNYTVATSTLSASATSYEITGLTNGTAYKFKVTCYDEVPNESSGATVSAYANASGTVSDSDMPVQSGLTDNGVARTGTQTMTGTVPNPTGLDDTYGGKAYLVLNDDKIPLSVTKSGSSSSSVSGRTFYKGSKEYTVVDGEAYCLDDADEMDFSSLSKAETRDGVTWTFTVTFSVNAGPNTIRIEIYDLSDVLFAATALWNIIGTIEPTSLVVTLWWNTDGTDIDLHVSPDDGTTHCYYGNSTAGGMVLDYDDTYGYGPEHITVDQVTGTKTYKIKVYYFSDNSGADTTTPTTASVTAAVNGETKLSGSQLMSVESYDSDWGTGSHIWDVGELEVSGENVYTVTLSDPDLTSFPEVTLPVTVTDPSNNNEHVSGLTSNNFYVVNAGTLMSDVTVTEGSSSYTLKYTDITSGARDLYVFVNVPAEGDTPRKGGLSNTKTYGTNYALLVGLNEYPAAYATPSNWDTSNYTIDVEPSAPAGTASVDADEFTIEFYAGATLDTSVTATSITSLGGGVYRLGYPSQDHSTHTTAKVKYEKEAWLSNCINDINDMEAALKAKATSMNNSAWEDDNIYILTNSGATETEITSKISTIASGMKKYDLFLFHFSGHGSGSQDAGDASQYLCAYEDANWISVTDLSNALDDIPQPGTSSYITNVFVFMDACHSGNFIGKGMERGFGAEVDRTKVPKFRPFMPQRGKVPSEYRSLKFSRDLQDMTNKNHVFVMTAVTGDKSAWDDSTLGNGVFTYYLVEGIDVSGKNISAALANANNDPWVTAEEAFAYLDPKANDYVSTTPGYPDDAVQDAQLQDNSTTTVSRLVYNW